MDAYFSGEMLEVFNRFSKRVMTSLKVKLLQMTTLQMLSPQHRQMSLCRGVVYPGESAGTLAVRASTFRVWSTIRKHKGTMMPDWEILLNSRVTGCGLWAGKGKGRVRARVKLAISFYAKKSAAGIWSLRGWASGQGYACLISTKLLSYWCGS